MRKAKIERETKETSVLVELNLDGTGQAAIDTSVPFFNHMLELMTYQSKFDLTIKATGDNVDNHHVIEDIGICLGKALKEALGDKAGINRYGFFLLPMDESLARVVIDLSGRAYLVYQVEFTREFLGDMETELFEEFFTSFTNNAQMNLHILSEYGRNNHHIVEGIFKCLGRTLRESVALTEDSSVPSTKGLLE